MWACEGREEPREGRNEEAKGASQKNEPRFSSWLVFAILIFHPPCFELLTLPPGQTNIRSPCHHHHLPHVETRAGGGPFRCFDVTPTTTSLVSKCEPEVVDFGISTRTPPPPPPSRPNASRRWSISAFRREPHHYHLPRFQTRVRGGSFRCFDANPTTTTSLASQHEPKVVDSGGFKASAAAATSLPPANRQWRKWIRGRG